MTVEDLIDKLSDFPPDMEIVVDEPYRDSHLPSILRYVSVSPMVVIDDAHTTLNFRHSWTFVRYGKLEPQDAEQNPNLKQFLHLELSP